MANNFFIAYDLDAPGQNYGRIEKAINECGSAFKVQLSLYYVKSQHSLKDITDHCIKAIDSNDRLLVIEASDSMFFNLLPGSTEFIQKHWNA